MAATQRINGVSSKCGDVMTKINNRDPHTMPLGDLYRLTGGWDGVREALGITMCTLSYKEKCQKILREHAEKEARMKAECAISIEKDRVKNAASSAIIEAKHLAKLEAKRSAQRKADEWGKFFYF